jgi:hypothetical protein
VAKKGGGSGGPGHGLTGGGPSIVGVQGAMRARDVSRPRPNDVAKAERGVVIRRQQPPDRAEPPRTP